MDGDGNLIWSRKSGNSLVSFAVNDRGAYVTADPWGGLLRKHAADGQLIWSKPIAKGELFELQLDEEDNIYGIYGAAFYKVGPDGSELLVHPHPDLGKLDRSQSQSEMVRDRSGNFFLRGTTNPAIGNPGVAGYVNPNPYTRDVILLKFSAESGLPL